MSDAGRTKEALSNLQPLGWFLVPVFLGLAIIALVFGQSAALCSVQERSGVNDVGGYQTVYVVDGPGLFCSTSGPFNTKQEAEANKSPGVSHQSDLLVFASLLVILAAISVPLFWQRR